MNDHGRARRPEQLGALPEVARVRSEQDGLATLRRLQHVVPARRHQAAADEDHVGEAVQPGQLAQGIEDDHRLAVLGRARSGAPDRREAAVTDQPLHLVRPLGMTRGHEQAEPREARLEPLVGVEDGGFLSMMGAPRDPQQTPRVTA